MKFVTINYLPQDNTTQIKVIDQDDVRGTSNVYGQTFITFEGFSYPVLFSSNDINKINDFVTVMKLGYQGLNVELA